MSCMADKLLVPKQVSLAWGFSDALSLSSRAPARLFGVSTRARLPSELPSSVLFREEKQESSNHHHVGSSGEFQIGPAAATLEKAH